MSKEHLPVFIWSPEFSKEFRNFKLKGKCPECAGFQWTFRLVKADGTPLPLKFGLFGLLERDTYVECKKCQRRFSVYNASNSHPQTSMKSPTVKVHLLPDRKRLQIANEVINVPQGVTITVKRSRVIEHTLDVSWKVSAGSEIELGLEPIIKTMVRGEIEKSQGRTYQETETMEYEIELNGEMSNRYTLIWTDIWLVGNTEIQQNNTTRILPFQFHEYSELEVNSG